MINHRECAGQGRLLLSAITVADLSVEAGVQPMGQAHWTAAYQRARATLRAQRIPTCYRCGRLIRYDLAWPHPLAFSADHEPPVALVGDHLNLVPAHARCQSRQGAGITNAKRRAKSRASGRQRGADGRSGPVTSKRWG